jgi:NAD(P)-dependent dehydrogenase (short-subunit alcohol dehydrogenase family)
MGGTLAGQVAIISGGLGDIGRAIGLELARRGADVAVGDVLGTAKADPLLAQIRGLGRRGRYDCADVTDAAAVSAWVDAVEQELGPATLIIPNAAISPVVRFGELTSEIWRRELAVNLDGAFYLAQAATRRLLHHGKPGRVVFIGSWAAHTVHLHIPAYCVSKAALRMLCRCMAAELAPHGILVNEVAPGYVDAGLTGKAFADDPALRRRCLQVTPTRQLIEPQEVADQVAYLCDPANRHLVGVSLVMDGGLTLFGPGGRRDD